MKILMPTPFVRYKVAAFLIVLIAGATTLSLCLPWEYWLHEVDRHWFKERVMDSLARWNGIEDWANAEPLTRHQDYSWVSRRRPVLIAHALGEAGTPGANTLPALERSYRAGMRLFEVDLWAQGAVLRCHHGPDTPPPLKFGGCRFETLLSALPADSWLVLDIKTDFASTGELVASILRRQGGAERVIFQLYAPEHLRLFNRWQVELPLPGPIVTSYLAHRRMDHVAQHTARVGVAVLTLPIERVIALTQLPEHLQFFVHPIHSCASLAEALQEKASGVYTLNSLRCSLIAVPAL